MTFPLKHLFQFIVFFVIGDLDNSIALFDDVIGNQYLYRIMLHYNKLLPFFFFSYIWAKNSLSYLYIILLRSCSMQITQNILPIFSMKLNEMPVYIMYGQLIIFCIFYSFQYLKTHIPNFIEFISNMKQLDQTQFLRQVIVTEKNRYFANFSAL